jgi:hypothetical protein
MGRGLRHLVGGGGARDFERAVTVRPRSHIARDNLAQAYLTLGRREEAAQEARIALNLYPSPEYQALVNQLASARQPFQVESSI